jgi:hypothetical protein
MTPAAFLAALRSGLSETFRTWAPWARGAWCRRQRRRLRGSDGGVVWLRGEPASSGEWAEWGASHGYFEVQYMDGLAYLRAVAARAA